MAHHCLTVALILNSFMNNELPIGLVVMAVHDISDVVLDLMKMVSRKTLLLCCLWIGRHRRF